MNEQIISQEGYDKLKDELNLLSIVKRKEIAERIERAMREVDDAAEREDQRQAERDQQVIHAVEQAVQHLLQKQSHVVRAPVSESGNGRGARGAGPRAPPEPGRHRRGAARP